MDGNYEAVGDELIDLGSVTEETKGQGGPTFDSLGQPKRALGLSDD